MFLVGFMACAGFSLGRIDTLESALAWLMCDPESEVARANMVPPPPPRSYEEWEAQIKALEDRRRRLKAQTLLLCAVAFGAAIIIVVTMVIFG